MSSPAAAAAAAAAAAHKREPMAAPIDGIEEELKRMRVDASKPLPRLTRSRSAHIRAQLASVYTHPTVQHGQPSLSSEFTYGCAPAADATILYQQLTEADDEDEEQDPNFEPTSDSPHGEDSGSDDDEDEDGDDDGDEEDGPGDDGDASMQVEDAELDPRLAGVHGALPDGALEPRMTSGLLTGDQMRLFAPYHAPADSSLASASDAIEDDGCSDFCPSDLEADADDSGALVPNPRLTGRKKYLDRANKAFDLVRNHNYPHGSPHTPAVKWVARLYKFNFEKRRWVCRGPTMLFFHRGQNYIHLVANYLYGLQSVALNLLVHEILDLPVSAQGRELRIRTRGVNVVSKLVTNVLQVPVSHLIQNAHMLGHAIVSQLDSVPVNHCEDRVDATVEGVDALYSIKFQDEQDCLQVQHNLEHFIAEARTAAAFSRANSFTVLLPILNHPNGEAIVSNFAQDTAFIEKLATCGLRAYPYFSKVGAVIQSAKCDWCDAEIEEGALRHGEPRVMHSSSWHAKHCRCPLASRT